VPKREQKKVGDHYKEDFLKSYSASIASRLMKPFKTCGEIRNAYPILVRKSLDHLADAGLN
jgi:hypothetical protein